MSLKTVASKLFAVAALSTAAFLPQTGLAQQSTYQTLPQALPSDTSGKIEVLEFFAYSCPHCAALEPLLEKWEKTLPDNVVLKRVPVAFNASMVDLQRLYYALESMGRLDLHAKVFQAIHKDHQRIFDQAAIAKWLAAQGVDAKQYEAAAQSFGVTSKVNRANELEQAYQVQGTPTLGVGGKYVTSPSMTGSYQGTIDQAQKLLNQVLGK